MIIGKIKKDGKYYRIGDPGFDDEPERTSCSAICSKRPWESTALAIHPSQVAQFNREAAAAKTGAYYKPDGTLQATSQGIRNRELARRGHGDANAGYGDRPPGG